MAERDVHGRTDGFVGKLNHDAADMGGAPDLLHRKVAEHKQYSATMAK